MHRAADGDGMYGMDVRVRMVVYPGWYGGVHTQGGTVGTYPGWYIPSMTIGCHIPSMTIGCHIPAYARGVPYPAYARGVPYPA